MTAIGLILPVPFGKEGDPANRRADEIILLENHESPEIRPGENPP